MRATLLDGHRRISIPQGETRQLTDASGTAVASYSYSPYGYDTNASPIANPFRYGGSVGCYTDPSATGLVLCGQRWYSPALARWLSRDPAGYGGGENLYAPRQYPRPRTANSHIHFSAANDSILENQPDHATMHASEIALPYSVAPRPLIPPNRAERLLPWSRA